MDNLMLNKSMAEVADYMRGLDCSLIGPAVYGDGVTDSVLSDITAVCRRAFKKKDVVVYVEIDSEDDEYEEGIVFTPESIFYWTDNGSVTVGIRYSEMVKVDYDETDIIIKTDEATSRISLGENAEDNKYPRYMYSFIMDILEYIAENKTGIEE